MTIKELLKIFKNASWQDDAQLETIVAAVSVDEIDAKAAGQMVDLLCSKRYASDLPSHTKRCALFAKLLDGATNKELFAPLIKALGQGDMRVRNVAAPLLAKVNNPAEHPQLCNLLKSPDVKVRKTVGEVLKQIGGKTVLEMLEQLVDLPNFAGRSEAMEVVMPIAGHYAIPVLQKVLVSGTQEEQLKALKYLGDTHFMAKAMPRALKAMLSVFETKRGANPTVTVQLLTSFAGLATEEAFFSYVGHFLDDDNPNVVRAAVWGLRHFSSTQVINILDTKVRSGAQAIRIEAMNSLEVIGKDDVLPPLVHALSSRDVTVRNRAGEVLSALSKGGKVEVSRVIIWLLRSKDVDVRRMAVEIARSIKDPGRELWPKLLAMLRDEDWWVRERVMDVLIEMAGVDLIPHVAALLEDSYDVVRRFAVDVLGRLGDAQVLGALIKRAREDEDWWVREKAIEAMVRLSDERAIPYIVEIMRADEDTRLVCMQALIDFKARDMVPHILELLSHEDADIRLAVLRCMREFNATEHASRIQKMLADPNAQVSRTAQELLIHWNIELNNEHLASRSKAGSFLDRMLTAVSDAKADDLILASGRKPFIKQMGKIVPLSSSAFTAEQVRALLTPQLSLKQMEELDAGKEVDFSYQVSSSGLRFRANVFHQHGGVGAVFRIIKGELSDLDQLGLPEVVQRFGDFRHGLVLFGGPTGSGKSTSLAAIIDNINRNTDRHVIALEDPIEVVHESKRGLVNQREIGTHTESFDRALRSTLRQDPDVILVGEMRDLETIAFAVTAAETGHLIFGTVHTANAHSSVDRLINTFPAAEQDQVRATIADNLRAVVCQYLLRRKDGQGRTLAAEVMINNDAIASMIRKGKTFQIPSVIATSMEQGMQAMDNQLLLLCRKGVISAEEAYMKANVKKDFEDLFSEEKKRPDEQVDVAKSLPGTEEPGSAETTQPRLRPTNARA